MAGALVLPCESFSFAGLALWVGGATPGWDENKQHLCREGERRKHSLRVGYLAGEHRDGVRPVT